MQPPEMRLHYCIYVYTINGGYQLRLSQEREKCTRAKLAAEFAWDGALIVEDLRKDYGERRFQALGLIGVGLAQTDHMRLVGARRENHHMQSIKREVKRYEVQA